MNNYNVNYDFDIMYYKNKYKPLSKKWVILLAIIVIPALIVGIGYGINLMWDVIIKVLL